jgi:hypothetical protein
MPTPTKHFQTVRADRAPAVPAAILTAVGRGRRRRARKTAPGESRIPVKFRSLIVDAVEEAVADGRLAINLVQWGELYLALLPEDFAEPASKPAIGDFVRAPDPRPSRAKRVPKTYRVLRECG